MKSCSLAAPCLIVVENIRKISDATKRKYNVLPSTWHFDVEISVGDRNFYHLNLCIDFIHYLGEPVNCVDLKFLFLSQNQRNKSAFHPKPISLIFLLSGIIGFDVSLGPRQPNIAVLSVKSSIIFGV